MKAAIIGYGKMGREIERILVQRGHQIVLKVDEANAADLNAANLESADVAFEFTTPATAERNIRTCLECGCAVVSGTTGWTEHLAEMERLCRERGGALFYASNYSPGVNIMFRLNKMLAEMMNRFDSFDVSLSETHHIHKKDAPSGTAITLAEQIAAGLDRKDGYASGQTDDARMIAVESIREGEIAGIHTVTYESEDERLVLSHTIKNRRTLAAGAVAAGEFLCGRKGVFGMEDMLK
ncbi:MAG: 4-hydroxy-tetrahydrodipicolinate reductase [Alistipes sp.]|nr:4-hydroxy-tetrahydrodipicolinate reductase [Alistipes sp.]